MNITVATYNICHGYYADFDWDRLSLPIRSVAPDLLGVQEVDMFTRRSQGVDSLAALARATGLPYALFVPTMDYDGGRYGTAILSRYPISDTVRFPLPSDGLEPRAAGGVRVSLPGTGPLWFFNTHLSHQSAEARHAQLALLAERMALMVPSDTPTLLCGDFNTEEPLFPVVGDARADINGDLRFPTFRASGIAIDRIVYTPNMLAPLDCGMVESDASDHNLLWARFCLPS